MGKGLRSCASPALPPKLFFHPLPVALRPLRKSSLMRALLINPPFPSSFWSFPEICRLEKARTYHPPLGLITVAAMLPSHWQLRLVDLNTRPLTPADWDWAQLVLLTGMLVQRPHFLELLKEAKNRNKPVVAGGPYPTSMSTEVLENGCDFLVRGEAENVITPLLSALKDGHRQGVFESAAKPDLTTSPIPRFDLLHLQDYAGMSIQTSRGCPYDCEFCDVVSLYGRRPRYKTAHQVLAELETLHRLGWRKSVLICDDNFISNKDHARAILHGLIPWMQLHGEPFYFWTQTSVELGHDFDMIDLMTQANFSTVFIGIETPDEDLLVQNRKLQNVRQPLVQSLKNINANGLAVLGSFILGFDGERSGAGTRIRAFVEETALPLVMLNLLQPLPHTRLWERLKKEGRLRQELWGDVQQNCDNTLGCLTFLSNRPEVEIMAEYRQAWDELYTPAAFLARAYRYFLAMRPTRRAQAQKKGYPGASLQSPRKATLKDTWQDMRRFAWLAWRQGIKSPCRWQFWRQLLGLTRHNPSRLVKYLTYCALGEDMFRLRRQLCHPLNGQGESAP